MFAYIGTSSNRDNPTINVVRKLHKRALIEYEHPFLLYFSLLHNTVKALPFTKVQKHTHTHNTNKKSFKDHCPLSQFRKKDKKYKLF